MCCRKWYFYIGSAKGNLWGQSIHAKNRIPHHSISMSAILIMLFDANAKEPLPDLLRTQCDSLRKALHKVRCKSCLSKYSDLVHIDEREQARFVLKYIEQVDSLLFLISACCSGDSETFRTRNLECESLPPTRATLLSHITRANYIAMRNKSYTTHCPVLPPIDKSRWLVEGTLYKPVMCLDEPAPKAVIELIKCGSKTGCVGSRCKCYSNKLPCTPLCKCYATECANLIMEKIQIRR